MISHLGIGQSALVGALLSLLRRCGRYPPSLLALHPVAVIRTWVPAPLETFVYRRLTVDHFFPS